MKITNIDTAMVAPRWLFVRIDTDDGITGWGEPVVEGRARTVAAAVHEMSAYLLGKDPLLIERHWQALAKGGFYRGGPVLSSAVAGIDQALWDIAGKHFQTPVYQLLGGAVRDRIRVYSWIGGDDPSDVADQAAERIAAGFTAVKMNGSGPLRLLDTPASIAAVVERVAAVRDAIGQGNDVAVDFHGRMTVAQSKRVLAELEPLHPMFVEEPVVPECSDRLHELTSTTSVPIATGERLYSRWDVDPVLRQGIAVIQPDISHAGGISEVRRIAAMAETRNVALAPHCPLGPIALAASVQVGAASPNLLIQEQSLGIHYNVGSDLLDYLVDPHVFRYDDGFIALPTAPGLGIDIDAAAVARAAEVAQDWSSPMWNRDDGSLAEW